MIEAIIVDDEDLIREGLKVLIDWEKAGVNIVFEATNGKDALDYIKEYQPHIAIVDIKMPELDGLGLIHEVLKAKTETLFIILSGYDNFSFAQQAIKMGAFRYLLKPVDGIELEECIREAIVKIKDECKTKGLINKFKDYIGEKNFEILDNGSSHNNTNMNELVLNNKEIKMVVNYINEHIDEKLSLDELAKLVFVHPSYLSHLFKDKFGENIIDYIIKIRIQRAKEYFTTTDLKLYEVAGKVGYSDFRYFSEVFKKNTGMSPSQYKKVKHKIK